MLGACSIKDEPNDYHVHKVTQFGFKTQDKHRLKVRSFGKLNKTEENIWALMVAYPGGTLSSLSPRIKFLIFSIYFFKYRLETSLRVLLEFLNPILKTSQFQPFHWPLNN